MWRFLWDLPHSCTYLQVYYMIRRKKKFNDVPNFKSRKLNFQVIQKFTHISISVPTTLQTSDGNIENFFVVIFIDIFLKIQIFINIVFFIYARHKNAKSEANIILMEYIVKGIPNTILFSKTFAVFLVPDEALKRPGHIFKSAPNISRISLGLLRNFSIKLFEVFVILCKFFQKSP